MGGSFFQYIAPLSVALLQDWLSANGCTAHSAPIEAGYNGPLTLPMLRRNAVLIEIN
jgi:deoxycytidine triphosphate deaminase